MRRYPAAAMLLFSTAYFWDNRHWKVGDPRELPDFVAPSGEQAHANVALYYDLPFISSRDGLWRAIKERWATVTVEELVYDAVHPDLVGTKVYASLLANYIMHRMANVYPGSISVEQVRVSVTECCIRWGHITGHARADSRLVLPEPRSKLGSNNTGAPVRAGLFLSPPELHFCHTGRQQQGKSPWM